MPVELSQAEFERLGKQGGVKKQVRGLRTVEVDRLAMEIIGLLSKGSSQTVRKQALAKAIRMLSR